MKLKVIFVSYALLKALGHIDAENRSAAMDVTQTILCGVMPELQTNRIIK